MEFIWLVIIILSFLILLLLTDCQEAEDDDNTMWYTKQLLTIVCRRVLGFVDDHCHSLIEIVENMDRNQRRDHLYVYGVYELTAEQIRHIEVSEVLTIKNNLIIVPYGIFVSITIIYSYRRFLTYGFYPYYILYKSLYQPKII